MTFLGIAGGMERGVQVIGEKEDVKHMTPLQGRLISAGVGLLFWGFIFLTMILPGIIRVPIYFFVYPLGIICVFVMLFCFQHSRKRTAFGKEMLGKITGFKNFLESVEKEKMEELILENPAYYYEILPYVYVLDISNKWITGLEMMVMDDLARQKSGAELIKDSDMLTNIITAVAKKQATNDDPNKRTPSV